MIISDPAALANLFVYIRSKDGETGNLDVKKSKNSQQELIKSAFQPHIFDTTSLKDNALFFSSLFSIDMGSSKFGESILADNTVKFFFETANQSLNQIPNLYSKFSQFSDVLSQIFYMQVSHNNLESNISSVFDLVKEKTLVGAKEIEPFLKTIVPDFFANASPENFDNKHVKQTAQQKFDSTVLKLAFELYYMATNKPKATNIKEFDNFFSSLDKNINDSKKQLLQKLIDISFLDFKNLTVNSSGALVEGTRGSVYLNLSDINFLHNFIGHGNIGSFVEHLSSIFQEKKGGFPAAEFKYSGEIDKILLMLLGLKDKPEILTNTKNLLIALALNSPFDGKNILSKDTNLLFSLFRDLFLQTVSQLDVLDKNHIAEQTNYSKLENIVNSKVNLASNREAFREFVLLAREFLNMLPSGADTQNNNNNVVKMLSRILNEMVINLCMGGHGESFAIPFYCEKLNDFLVYYQQDKKSKDAKSPKSKKRFCLSFATEKLGAVSVDIVSGNSLEVYLRAKKEGTREMFKENMPQLHNRLEAIQSKSVTTY